MSECNHHWRHIDSIQHSWTEDVWGHKDGWFGRKKYVITRTKLGFGRTDLFICVYCLDEKTNKRKHVGDENPDWISEMFETKITYFQPDEYNDLDPTGQKT